LRVNTAWKSADIHKFAHRILRAKPVQGQVGPCS
jgi:hypothetical protein